VEYLVALTAREGTDILLLGTRLVSSFPTKYWNNTCRNLKSCNMELFKQGRFWGIDDELISSRETEIKTGCYFFVRPKVLLFYSLSPLMFYLFTTIKCFFKSLFVDVGTLGWHGKNRFKNPNVHTWISEAVTHGRFSPIQGIPNGRGKATIQTGCILERGEN